MKKINLASAEILKVSEWFIGRVEKSFGGGALTA